MSATGRLVAVEWEDTSFSLDDEMIEAYLVTTVGYVVQENQRFISVGSERLDAKTETCYRAITAIPRRSIIRIVDMEDV